MMETGDTVFCLGKLSDSEKKDSGERKNGQTYQVNKKEKRKQTFNAWQFVKTMRRDEKIQRECVR